MNEDTALQMLYNYLAFNSLAEWPKEKSVRLLSLLNIKTEDEIKKITVNGDYIIEVDNRLNEGVKDSSNREVIADLKGFNKKEQEVLSDIINLLKIKKQNGRIYFQNLKTKYRMKKVKSKNKKMKCKS